MEPFLPFLLATAVGVFLAGLTYLFGRKSGLVPAQASLITTLQANAEALEHRVGMLSQSLSEEQSKRAMLEVKVERMETLIVDLVAENSDLRRRLGMPIRRARTEA
jgi:hypothetical protein